MTFQELMDCYKINKNENNSIVYNQLLEMLKKQNITPIIGAGISSWAYPLWGNLLKELSTGYGIENDIEHLLENNKYEDAATLLESVITPPAFADQLKLMFHPTLMDKNASKRPEYLKSIPKLFPSPIVTTNFDQVIENLFSLYSNSKIDTITPFDKDPIKKIERVLAKKEPLLIKMHGDVEDSDHLILTKEAYDSTYGTDPEHPDFKLPMPYILKTILEHNPPLFLGCSLNIDRTYSILKNCALKHVKFAFLELPQETYREATPYKPVLHTDDRRLIESFQNRRKNIVKFNIRVIWYPHGKHDEAYNSLFSQLSEDLGIIPPANFDTDVNYALLHPLLGRTALVNNIAEKLIIPSSCVWVEGAAGIGKTEVCKKVYHVLKKKYPNLVMPYIDTTGISSLSAFFDVIIKETYISIPNPIESETVSQIVLKKLKEKYSLFLRQQIPVVMYFDNFEDIWLELTSEKEKDKLIRWMRELMSKNINILVSSRALPPALFNCFKCHVSPLDNDKEDISMLCQEDFDKLDSVNLFYNVLGRTIAPKEKEAFRTLIRQLEGHPLAIVLTATQAQKEISLNELLDRWHNARQDTLGMRDAHKNLAVALKVSWNTISTNKAAIIQWGLLYYSLKEIPAEIFGELRGNTTDEDWQEGFHVLNDANLIDVTSDRNAITMLLPLKKQFVYLISPNKNIQETCLIQWSVYVEKLLDMTGKYRSSKRSPSPQLAVEFVPQIFYIMEQLMLFETDSAHYHLNQIVEKVRHYYIVYVRSEILLEKLIHYYENMDYAEQLPIVLEDYGNLLRRFGKLTQAKQAYDRAEPLYRKKNDNKGLANLLKSRGDLFRRQGELDEAKIVYGEAEKLYRQEDDNWGLANLLKSRGDLLCRLANLARSDTHSLNQLRILDEAKIVYGEAEKLYRQEDDNWGLANLLKSRGDLLCRLNSLDEAKEVYDEAKKLYTDERDNSGLANLLKAQGDLFRQQNNLNKASESYDAAEQLYRKAEDKSGMKDLLKSQDNLQHRLKSENR